ncbi:MAG: hypothetical protein A3F68_12625 [Acidobacteria bacterium RIFCSPLOWO2_12_FULL_54_10]|nr:MAG: hypothetical protein A3F68_12625 [Acidobacteria bacterium RIFCSPLOWO2_12_FULL_54_10]
MAKILLADDSMHAQRMGAKILSGEGHEVTTVSNGQAAFKKLEESIPDFVIADIFMPGRNGYELCQLIKSNPKWGHIPVVLLIGAMEPYDSSEGSKVKADAVITKPLESSDLVSTVAKLLGSVKKVEAPVSMEEPEEEPATQEPESVMVDELITQTSSMQRIEIPAEFSDAPLALLGDMMGSENEQENAPIVFPEGPPPDLPAPGNSSMSESGSFDPSMLLLASSDAQVVTGDSTVMEALLNRMPEGDSIASTDESSNSEPARVRIGNLEFDKIVTGDSTVMAALLSRIPENQQETAVIENAASAPAPILREAKAEEAKKANWIAESLPVTAEDEKIFSQRPDWDSLTKLTEENEQVRSAASTQESRVVENPPEPVAEMIAAESVEAQEKSPRAMPTASALPAQEDEGSSVQVAPIDRKTIHQLVRDAVEEIIPVITDRILKTIESTSKQKP